MRHPLLVTRTYDLVLRKLASRAWSPGKECPSVRELARDLKMSRKPVHEAFRMAARDGLVTVRPRRRAAVRSGAARRAKELLGLGHITSRRRRVALMIPEEYFPLRGAPIQHKLARVVGAAASERGWECEIVRAPGEDQCRLARRAARRYDAAFVVDVSPRKLAFLFTLAEHSFPMLMFNRQVAGIDHAVLTTDNYGASRQVGRLLLDRGHRNLCFITSPKHENTDCEKSTTNGWVSFLEESDLLRTSTMPLAYYKTPAMFPVLMEQLLRLRPAITGFVLRIAADMAFLGSDPRFGGLRIPGDISLATTGPMADIWWPSHHPPVTSFEIDWDRAGRCAVEMLDQMLGGNPHPKSIRVPLNIHLTDSIGRAPTP